MAQETAAPRLAATVTLVLGIVVLGSNSFVLSPILTDVAQAFDTTPVVVARVISAFGGANAVSAFLFASAIDRIGARPVLLGGGAALTLALAASALATRWEMLAAAQTVAGLAGGVMLPAIYTMATATAPEGQGAKALSRVLNGWALSLVAGVPASAFMTQLFGWRAAYVALAALTFLACIGFLRLPRARPARSGAAAMSSLKALAIPGVAPLLLICAAFMTAFYGAYAFLGDHLRTALGLTAGEAGLAVMAYGFGFGLASVAGGAVDRLGPRRVFPVALAISAALYLALSPATETYLGAILVIAAVGFVNHFGLTILVLLQSQRRPEARGAIMGLHSATTYLAVFVGPLALGALYGGYGYGAVVAASSALALGAAAIAALAPWRRADLRTAAGER